MSEKNRQQRVNNADNAAKTDGGTKKSPFLSSRYYDRSDIDEAAQRAYSTDMDEAQLKAARRRDWLFLLIGIPALIGLIYLIGLILK